MFYKEATYARAHRWKRQYNWTLQIIQQNMSEAVMRVETGVINNGEIVNQYLILLGK